MSRISVVSCIILPKVFNQLQNQNWPISRQFNMLSSQKSTLQPWQMGRTLLNSEIVAVMLMMDYRIMYDYEIQIESRLMDMNNTDWHKTCLSIVATHPEFAREAICSKQLPLYRILTLLKPFYLFSIPK